MDCHATAEEILIHRMKTIKELLSSFNEKAYRIGLAMPSPFLYKEGIFKIKGFDKY